MIVILAALGVGAVCFGYYLSEQMMRDSSIEEMKILLDSASTRALLESCWGEEEFPAFFSSTWNKTDRDFYIKLAKDMRDNRYGKSRKLIKKLVKREDARFKMKDRAGKKPSAASTIKEAKNADIDDEIEESMKTILEEYKKGSGFESILAEFIEKRHKERIYGNRR